MNELYEKIGSGINKIQGTIQSSQTLSQYKKVIQDTTVKRTEILVQLGEEVYKKLRNKEIESDDLKSKSSYLDGIRPQNLSVSAGHCESACRRSPTCLSFMRSLDCCWR